MDEFANKVINEFLEQRDDLIIFDVGAHNGDQLSHYWLHKNCRFFLFEPTPSLFAKISNAAQNYPNVKVINKAVSDIETEQDFHIIGD